MVLKIVSRMGVARPLVVKETAGLCKDANTIGR